MMHPCNIVDKSEITEKKDMAPSNKAESLYFQTNTVKILVPVSKYLLI